MTKPTAAAQPHTASPIDTRTIAGAEFSTPGAAGKPVCGTTSVPQTQPRGVAILLHGWTGHRDRNIIPVAAKLLTDAGLITHRINLSHCGIPNGHDAISEHSDFQNDRLDNATDDVKAVIKLIERGNIPGTDLPLVLAGHSRGASQAIRIAATAEREAWNTAPAAVIALAPPAAHTRFPDHEQRELAETGYVERPVARATGGIVRMGPSWFAHRFDEAGNLSGRDVFAEDCQDLTRPLLLLHAENDDAVGPEHPTRFKQLFKDTPTDRITHHIIQNADHNFSAKGLTWDTINANPNTIHTLEQHFRRFLDRIFADETHDR